VEQGVQEEQPAPDQADTSKVPGPVPEQARSTETATGVERKNGEHQKWNGAFDESIGGLPSGSIITFLGEADTGMTTCAEQILYQGLTEGRPAVYSQRDGHGRTLLVRWLCRLEP